MSTLQIPSFLSLTGADWRAGSLIATSAAKPPEREPDAPVPADREGPGRGSASEVPASRSARVSPQPSPDEGPTLTVRALPDGRLGFTLRSKVGATLLAGESQVTGIDPAAFGRRVLDRCTVETALNTVADNDGIWLELEDAAGGFRARSRAAGGPAHVAALRRLIALQAGSATVRLAHQ